MSDWKAVPVEMLEFLDGAAPLDGVWFGDPNPKIDGGEYWWRSVLRAAIAAPPAPTDAPLKRERLIEIRNEWLSLGALNDEDREWAREMVALCNMALQSLALPAAQAAICSECKGEGWTTQPDPRNGDACQVQCEPCLGTGKLAQDPAQSEGEPKAVALLLEAREVCYRAAEDELCGRIDAAIKEAE
jgi:hypothetical protein